VFAKTANGYLRHMLDVLIWGPFVTVDAIIEVPTGIVLVKRSNPPLGYALPGGFVDYGESLEAAVHREAMEETGLELQDLKQFHTYSDPTRDPRFHTITTVFSARAVGTPRAGDDAAEVHIVQRDSLDGLSFAFDHGQVLKEWARQS
jgi:ADP-ribose pyrophosphatase YjhB (NUDIX family)